MNIVLLGPPGAGKGTQAKRLESKLGVPAIASGDLFRAIREEDTPLAQTIRGYMDRGEYVPDDITIELVFGRLAQPDARRGFILDGFPRTLGQAEALDRRLAGVKRRVDAVLFITAPAETVLNRISGRLICPQCHAIYNLASKPPRQPDICDVCGHQLERRTDEEVSVVRERLATFVRQTAPLVEYYRSRGVLTEVDGSRPIDQVEAEVDGALERARVVGRSPAS